MKRFLVGLAVAVVLALSAGSVRADVATLPTPLVLIPGQPMFIGEFPNEFDLVHEKFLLFEALAQSLDGGDLVVTFDFLEPRSGMFTLRPPVTVPIPPTGTMFFPVRVEDLLPFCPQFVSIHLEALGSPIQLVQAQFTHECLVPEPSSVALLGLGSLGLVGYVYRRRQRVA